MYCNSMYSIHFTFVLLPLVYFRNSRSEDVARYSNANRFFTEWHEEHMERSFLVSTGKIIIGDFVQPFIQNSTK